MIPFGLHRRIPLVRRPFYQRDCAVSERDQAAAERDRALSEREQAAISSEHLRKAYLDLLIRTLANTIYGDPNFDRVQPHEYNPALRAEGQDWPSQAHTMVGLARLHNLRDLAESALVEGVPGDFMETGIWRGGCCILLRGVLEAYGDTQRRVFAADSFRGLPPPVRDEDLGDEYFTYHELAVSLSKVRDNFARYGLLDDRTVFIEGFFEDTLPELAPDPLAVLRLDGDMYGSTIVALENLYPRVSPGGFVIIDDYGALPGCCRAVNDYRTRAGITAPIEHVDWTGVWWRKPSMISETDTTRGNDLDTTRAEAQATAQGAEVLQQADDGRQTGGLLARLRAALRGE